MTDHFFDGHPEGVPPAHHDPAPRPAALADDDLFWATFRLGNVHRVLLRSMEQDLENEDLPTPYAMFRSVGNDALRADACARWDAEVSRLERSRGAAARVERQECFFVQIAPGSHRTSIPSSTVGGRAELRRVAAERAGRRVGAVAARGRVALHGLGGRVY